MQFLKRIVLRELFRRIQLFFSIGDQNEAFYREHGVAPEKIISGTFPVDVKRFSSVNPRGDDAVRKDLRATFGLQRELITLVFSGKLIDRKRSFDVVEALERLHKKGLKVQAIFIGTGPLADALVRRIDKSGLAAFVHFPGFVNQKAIPQYLGAGDILVFPSETDNFGVSVAEAICLGLAVVTSDGVGCVGEKSIARPGVNALVYPAGNIEELVPRLELLIKNPSKLRTLQVAARQISQIQDRYP